MMSALAGHVAPQPVNADWGSGIVWPGPAGAAVIGVRSDVTSDLEVVRAAVTSQTPVIVVGGAGRGVPGVREVLTRDCPANDLIASLLVMRRQRPTAGRPDSTSDPTRRELEVVTLLSTGMSNREIAGQLFISEYTVRNHLGHIFGKLGVSSRTQAVMKAGEVGWLRLPE